MLRRQLPIMALALTAVLMWSCHAGSIAPPAQTLATIDQGAQTRPHGIVTPLVYVSNALDSSVTAYDANDRGDVAPDIRIAGPHTQIVSATGIALDSMGRLYVCCGANGVNVYAPGATGDVAPVGTIGCAADPFIGVAVAIGPTPDEDVVLGQNLDAPGVAINWVEQEARGCVTPHVIGGPNTDINSPNGVAVGRDGRIYSANGAPDFGVPGVTVDRRDASGDSVPLQFISGPKTTLFDGSLDSLALDDQGLIYALSSDFNDASGFISVFNGSASGDASPVKVLRGAASRMSGPFGIALDHHGMIYVSNLNDSVTIYNANAAGAFGPVRVIAGPRTLLDGPEYIAVYDPR